MITHEISEILLEINSKSTQEDAIKLLVKYDSFELRTFLQLAFHPNINFYITSIPDNFLPYKESSIPGNSSNTIRNSLNKLYLFTKGNPIADNLTQQKRNQLILNIINDMFHHEITFLFQLFNKSLSVNNINYQTVKSIFPNLLP
jgi:hypothetical protein